MPYWIDTHAHVYLKEFKPDLEAMLSRAKEAEVNRIYMPNIDHTSIDDMMELETKSEGGCVSMMGLHPCYVKKDFEKELYLIEEWLSKRKFVAVGEIGTDLYWDNTFWEQQKEAFTIQIAWAKKYQIPVVIHCRESIDETIELLQPMVDENLKGVFHCFSGSREQAEKIVAMGFYLGLGGVATFKNTGLDKVIPDIDLKNIVLETDSPYLAPVPHRGKRNEPAHIPLIAQRICELKKVTIQQMKEITTANANTLFHHVL